MAYSPIKFYPALQPLAFLYATGVMIRNLLFDWKLLPSEQYPVPVICVGNLAVGGTGKTPMVEYLIRLLCDKYRVAVLSRGYKRKSSGYVLANENSTASEIGDEASQIKYKFPRAIIVVDKNRRRGMRNLMAMPEDIRPQVVLLDDGYQHRFVKPSFSILITDYNRLFYRDRMLPAGRLRESAHSASRADMVLVSKCPENIDQIYFDEILKKMSRWIPSQLLFFTRIAYQPPEKVFPQECEPCKLEKIRKDDDILLITGIANPTPLIEEMKKYSDKVSVITFNDHHAFTKKDIQKIQSELSEMTSAKPLIICTEKDAARIRHNPHCPNEWKSQMYYIPIRVHFLFDRQEQFESHIMSHITFF